MLPVALFWKLCRSHFIAPTPHLGLGGDVAGPFTCRNVSLQFTSSASATGDIPQGSAQFKGVSASKYFCAAFYIILQKINLVVFVRK